MYSADETAKMVGISIYTLNNWYKWNKDTDYVKPENLPELPTYMQEKERAPRYWTKEAINVLIDFKSKLPHGRAGVMGDFNARSWQSRGVRALSNKNRTDLISKYNLD